MSYFEDLPSVPARFDFDVLGAALGEVLVQPAEGATVIGIHGPWGSGKTTLMYAVRDALVEAFGSELLIVVDFNAWKYHEREALWRALILRLVGAMREHAATTPAKLTELERSLYDAFEVSEAGPWTVNWRQAAIEVASVGLEVAQLGFAGNVLRRLAGKKNKDEGLVGEADIERIAGMVERRSVSRHVEQIRSIEQFLSLFREVVDDLCAAGHRLVVLVDDLDRCLPEAALQIFEAIKLFLDAPGCGFVVAVDRDVIKKGLAIRYADVQGMAAGTPLVNPDEYIEKTIALSYDVPRLSEDDLDSIMDTAQLPYVLGPAERTLLRLGLGTNPRRIKRFLNVVRVQMDLAERMRARGHVTPRALGPDADATERAALLKTMLIGYRYSTLLQRVSEDARLLPMLQKAATAYRKDQEDAPESARETRQQRLVAMPADVRGLVEHEALWSLLGAPPDLVVHEEAIAELTDWFRGTGLVDAGAGAAPVVP